MERNDLTLISVKIPGIDKPQKTLREEVFRYFFEDLGYTRKDFTEKLNLNHRRFTTGLRAYYNPEDIEELRVKKIVNGNIGSRVKTWDDKLGDVEKFIPNYKTLFRDNLKDNPEMLMQLIVKTNQDFYKFKEAIKPIKKYLNQALKRRGLNSIRLVSNGLEAKVATMLSNLQIDYVSQYRVGKHYYDFYLTNSNTLLEVHGKQFHTSEPDIKKDKLKSKLAKKSGYNYYSITDKQIKTQPIKTKECLKKLA